jgi:hypothetical protein
MIGFPWENAEMMEQTADFALGLGLSTVFLFSATPLPGSRLWKMGKSNKLSAEIDFRKPEINLTRMSNQSYAALYKRLSERFDEYNESIMMKKFQKA